MRVIGDHLQYADSSLLQTGTQAITHYLINTDQLITSQNKLMLASIFTLRRLHTVILFLSKFLHLHFIHAGIQNMFEMTVLNENSSSMFLCCVFRLWELTRRLLTGHLAKVQLPDAAV